MSTAKMLFIAILAVVYFISPIDFLPDILGPLGRSDDLIVAIIVVYIIFFKPLILDFKNKNSNSTKANANGKPNREHKAPHDFDPYKILGLENRKATASEIKAAYKKKITEYHPDKVENLGPELKSLAMEKTIEINRAYEMLK